MTRRYSYSGIPGVLEAPSVNDSLNQPTIYIRRVESGGVAKSRDQLIYRLAIERLKVSPIAISYISYTTL